jgi:nucleotide-binding universal stress UspA family protein
MKAIRETSMKSILIPTGGSDADFALFDTALAAARLFHSHLHFLHVHIGAGEAALNMPHTEFAMGPALSNALAQLEQNAETRAVTASQHFHDFCAKSSIDISDTPAGTQRVTACWHEVAGDAIKRILFSGRHSDLVVVGRAKKPNGMPRDFIEQLLIHCGRPVLISASAAPQRLTDTVMVCWRETAEAVRALGAAMPFLLKAKRVVVTGVAERDQDIAESLDDVVRHLSWHGVPAEVLVVKANGHTVAELLTSAAQACTTSLMVLGAYGHSRMREALFGGSTQSFIRYADRPVLLMH